MQRDDITELFCFVDDFAQTYENIAKEMLLDDGEHRNPTRKPTMSLGEMMTIILLFHRSPCRNFKSFYTRWLKLYDKEFPARVAYERFVALEPRIMHPFLALSSVIMTKATGISYVDSSALAVCHAKRMSRNKVFKGVAKIGRSTMGWFFGFKLHLVMDDRGNLISFTITPGNAGDTTVLDKITRHVCGLLFGDKGYISQKLFQKLYERGLKLVTSVKKTMKNKFISLKEKLLLGKRSIIESVFNVLKNKFQIEHTRHRSPVNAFIHIISTLVDYQLLPEKPAISCGHRLPANP